jgi:hypothetical protein
MRETQIKWKQVIVKPECPEEYLHTDTANPEVIRKARVRLDCTAMPAFRFFLLEELETAGCVYQYLGRRIPTAEGI